MTGKISVRIDKFLWAVRIFKSRSMAADECRMGRILVNEITVKPSRLIEGNELLAVRKPPANFTYRIKEPVEKRVPAKLVMNFLEDLTPESEKIKEVLSRTRSTGYRPRGAGRPTKKERRTIDCWKDDLNST